MRYSHSVGALLLAGVTLLISASSAAPEKRAGFAHAGGRALRFVGQTQKPTPPAKERKRTLIGDVVIEDFDSIKGKTDLSGVRLVGAKTRITVPEKQSNATLLLHADLIQSQKEGKETFGLADMKGNLRYTLTQKTKQGTRVLEGVAAEGNYRRATKMLVLTGSIRATLTDAEQFLKPATFHGGRVVVDMSQNPFVYTIEGDPANNDIRFSPLGQGQNNQAVEAGDVHVHGYSKASFQAAHSVRFEGANTTAEIISPDKTEQRLQAEQLIVEFTEDGKVVKRAEATNRVRFSFDGLTRDKKGKQTLAGTCQKCTYEGEEVHFEMTGGVEATLTAPDSLLEPAKLRADHLAASVTEDGTRYEIAGRPEQTLLKFRPRPHTQADAKAPQVKTAPSAPQKDPNAPKKKPFPFGTVKISGFDSGVYEIEKRAAFVGSKTLFQTNDPDTGTQTRLLAGKVEATLNAETLIERAEATGNVRFRIQQPTPETKTMQAVAGSATSATFINADEGQRIEVRGPLHADVEDSEHLARPGLILGDVNDLLILTLGTDGYDYEMNSPMQTGRIEFTPKEEDPDKKKQEKPTKGKKPVKKP